MREWFEAGGIEPVYDGESATPEDAVARLKASGAELACLCSDDEDLRRARRGLRRCGQGGRRRRASCSPGVPATSRRACAQAGVDEFVFMGGDAIAALKGLYKTSRALEPRGRARWDMIPNFSKVAFLHPGEPAGRRRERRAWSTPEGSRRQIVLR